MHIYIARDHYSKLSHMYYFFNLVEFLIMYVKYKSYGNCDTSTFIFSNN